ncbi:NUDIX domain-containing protein [Nocardia sp. NPDC004168]|uniref:NUDIX hydrolase n=1 Tax=Nocardia sp. NPDC004168 TaxID=3154452 RepID=UPI0033A368EB
MCYIVRGEKLLVFRHTEFSWEEVGIQVPAGSIQAGESPADAALREACEETGLTEFTVVRELGRDQFDVRPNRFETHRRHFFQLALHRTTPERWASQEDHDGLAPPTKLECFWIPLTAAHVLQSGQSAMIGRLFD